MSAAKALGQDVHVLVAGADCKAVAEAAAKLDGAAKVLLADAPQLGHQLAEEMAALIVGLMAQLRRGASPPPRRRARTSCRASRPLLDVMQISDIIKVVSPDTFERPIYAGNAIQTVQIARQEEGHHRAHHGLSGGRQQRLGSDRDHRRRRHPWAFRVSRRPRSRSPTGRS